LTTGAEIGSWPERHLQAAPSPTCSETAPLAPKIGLVGDRAGDIASTILNESNLFNRDWIERQLAHVERNEVRRAYNAAEWMPDRRRMMQWWQTTSPPWPQNMMTLFRYRKRAKAELYCSRHEIHPLKAETGVQFP
jgi:hypothetical protein